MIDPLSAVVCGIVRSLVHIRIGVGRRSVPAMAGIAAGAVLLVGAAFIPEASAAANYVIKESIQQHLERTDDEHGLCQRKGMAMNQMLVFMPGGSGGVSVYWHRATDRFVQYPGLSACSVWKRLGA